MPDIQISEALLQLSLFVRLENLNLHLISSGSNRNVHQIDVSLSMIAQNWIKLKNLSLTFNHNQNTDLKCGQLIQNFGSIQMFREVESFVL